MLKNKRMNKFFCVFSAVMLAGNLAGINALAESLDEHYFSGKNASTPSETWNGESNSEEVHELELIGSDEIQNKKSTQLVNVSEYQESYEVEVYASLPSEFTVSIPKIITLDATGENETRFAVGVKGSLAPHYAVTSTADPLLELVNTQDAGKKFNASISTYTDSLTLSYGWELLSSDIYNGDGIGFYKIDNERAPAPGSYRGTFNIRIDLIDLTELEES